MQTRKLSDTRTRTASLRVAAAVLLAAALVLLFISAPSWAQADDTAVSNLALSSTSPGEIAITWDAPSRAPGDYRVTWKKSSGNWPSYKNANTANGGNAFPAVTSHTVSGMEEGTAYSVRVRARYLNGEGNVDESGPWTDSLQVTVASTPPPPATPEPTTPPSKGQGEGGGDDNSQPRSTNPPAKPQGLLAAAMHNSVSLFWNNPNDDSITGYQVLRGPDAANLTVLNNDTGDKNTSYTDDTVTAETAYVYAVLARNANGLSAQSDTTTASTPAAPEEPESARSIAGAEFTLDGKALDTTGTCSETDVASISDDCTINIIIKAPVFAVVGTLDSNDRITIKAGRDKTAVDGASTSADESTLRGTDQTVVLTFPEGTQPHCACGATRTAQRATARSTSSEVNVLPSWTLDGQTLPTHSNCRQVKDATNPDYSSSNCSVQTGKTNPNFQFVNTLHAHYNVYVYVNGNTAINQPGSSNVGDAVALSLNPGVNRVKVRLATKSHDHVPENYRDEAFYYQVNVGHTAEIEAVKSRINEGEEEIQFRITLSSAAPAGGVDVMVEIAPVAPYAYTNPVSVNDYKTHTVHIAQGQTEAILEILTTRDQTISNIKGVTGDILPGTGYQVGTRSQGTVLVDDPDQVNIRFADGCGQTITVG